VKVPRYPFFDIETNLERTLVWCLGMNWNSADVCLKEPLTVANARGSVKYLHMYQKKVMHKKKVITNI
jgi:hypothetical protein